MNTLSPEREAMRVKALQGYCVLDTPAERAFDDLCLLASQVCQTPVALITLIDADRQWFKAKVGVDLCDNLRSLSFCEYTLINPSKPLVVPDLRLDARFVDNPFVTGEPHARFYAGVPLTTGDGLVLGTLCVLDLVPRQLTELQLRQLRMLADQVMDQLTLRKRAEEFAESERRFKALFHDSPVAIVLIDEDDSVIEVNDELCELTGLKPEELLGRTGFELAQTLEFSSNVPPAVLIAAAPDGIGRTETRLTRPDGTHRWAIFTLTHVVEPGGGTRTLGHLQDITDRKLSEQATLDSETNLAAVARVIHRIQSGSDARQTVVDAGVEMGHAAFVSLVEPVDDRFRVSASNLPVLVGVELPIDSSSVTGQVFHSGEPVFVADPASHPLVSPTMLQLTDAASIYFMPVRSADSTLAVLLVAWREAISGLDDQRARAVTLLASQAGVALRQAALLAELESLALTDTLTELPNRRSWNQLLNLQLSSAKRSGAPLTIALADLDHFKRFNDTLGHPAGDALLRAFSESARLAVRADDLVARWGGEEFAFALPNCSAEEAHLVLDRVRGAVPLLQTCSIGFAVWNGHESADQLLHRADQALYEVKQNGRNRVAAA